MTEHRCIDIHTHILPKEIPNFKQQFGYGGFIKLSHCPDCSADMLLDDGTFFRKIGPNCWDPKTRIDECDTAGVSLQVLSTVPAMFSYQAKPYDGASVASFLNHSMAQVVDAYPDRFVALGTIPLQDTRLAIKELEYCMKTLGFAGVEIGSNVNQENLSEPRLFDFFAACSELSACVLVHPWNMAGKEDMQRYWLPWLVGMPAETSRAICSLIFGGVLERLPRLKVAFAHGGGSFPFTLGRIRHGFQVRPDLCAQDNPVDPINYRSRLFFDSLVHDERALSFLIDTFGVEQVMCGSDYPFPLGEHSPGKGISEASFLKPADKDKLLYHNAHKWLDLKDQR